MKKFHMLERSIKYISKINALNFKIVTVSQPCVQFFLLRSRFKALTEKSLIFGVSLSECLRMSNPKALKTSSISPKGPTTPEI